ncbi:MAG: DUF2333 family protein [Shewanella psychromarinicola]|jgi:hypothetical protein|uniref:DUF2333 family protein n=1 Tax=Shewanella psychromarinicola TaxID=2487742 RepID=A0A3N4E4Z9_9GAMM|nr:MULTISPECIES: DUF2333 family protein [Shewanella]AZG37420.1 DUF2333 family protein [Shewanella psychromarinicola]MCL1080681.1 DUF2333 family protein [Shewanella psychromarinicola]PKG79895.1 DUF2333 domain-containing protein [Shewanella sp. Actino-trap-3]RPA33305.1 DUF2333 family protein [Shewanella psychromarinicola]|tara:strand:- start:19569 stop:20540 length:972 start_codon:yes stop_codon:yes gene_type:complete
MQVTRNKILAVVGVLCLVLYFMSVWWSVAPDPIKPVSSKTDNGKLIVGYATTTSLIATMETLLDKPGGWLSNDIMPPSVMMDNMPAFEFGALEQARDLALTMRKEFSRSQSQSTADDDLLTAHSKLNIDNTSWLVPSAEGEYRDAIKLLKLYRAKINDAENNNAQFYARADNLNEWLKEVQKRLGSISQNLSASVGQERLNTDLAGDISARQSTPGLSSNEIKTSWWKIDDVFYQSRGSAWALLNFMRAIEVDFADVLANKNAAVSLRQIIRELEATQQTVWSPLVLNGNGFGLVANHSLVMANYISRANAAVIDLTNLLSQG